MWFIGVEVEQETSAPPPKKNPGSAPESSVWFTLSSEDETVFCDTQNFFQLDCRSRFSKRVRSTCSKSRSQGIQVMAEYHIVIYPRITRGGRIYGIQP